MTQEVFALEFLLMFGGFALLIVAVSTTPNGRWKFILNAVTAGVGLGALLTGLMLCLINIWKYGAL